MVLALLRKRREAETRQRKKERNTAMAILRSMDGKFYNIPDDQLGEYEMGPDEVKEQLGAAGGGPGGGGPMGGGPGGGGNVTPQGYWRNCWRNCWRRNCWRNCY